MSTPGGGSHLGSMVMGWFWAATAGGDVGHGMVAGLGPGPWDSGRAWLCTGGLARGRADSRVLCGAVSAQVGSLGDRWGPLALDWPPWGILPSDPGFPAPCAVGLVSGPFLVCMLQDIVCVSV